MHGRFGCCNKYNIIPAAPPLVCLFGTLGHDEVDLRKEMHIVHCSLTAAAKHTKRPSRMSSTVPPSKLFLGKPGVPFWLVSSRRHCMRMHPTCLVA